MGLQPQPRGKDHLICTFLLLSSSALMLPRASLVPVCTRVLARLRAAVVELHLRIASVNCDATAACPDSCLDAAFFLTDPVLSTAALQVDGDSQRLSSRGNAAALHGSDVEVSSQLQKQKIKSQNYTFNR